MIGKRKFFMASAIIVLTFILALLKFVGAETWATIVLGVLGIFGTANVADKKLNGQQGNG